MLKQETKTSSKRKRSSAQRKPRGATLGSLNRWLDGHYDEVVRKAEANCVRLTGKPRL